MPSPTPLTTSPTEPTVTRLTVSAADDRNPDWSPDGQRIAFSSERHENGNIYVMNSDGSEVTRLTNADRNVHNPNPDWSPDGQRIAHQSYMKYHWNFLTGYEYSNRPIQVMNADGSDPRSIQSRPDDDQSGWSPAWAPDGGRIAFTSDRDGDDNIYTIDVESTPATPTSSTPTTVPTGRATPAAPATEAPGAAEVAKPADKQQSSAGMPTGAAQGTTTSDGFASVSAGGYHTCKVREDGSVACWGFDYFGQSTPPEGEFASVSAGSDHTCGVRVGGSVACWGSLPEEIVDSSQHDSMFTPPEGKFASVSAGGAHTCGVKTNGVVAC